MNIVRKFSSGLGLLLLIIGILALSGYLHLTSPRGEAWLCRQLMTRLGNELQSEVTIQLLETNLFSALTLRGLRLSTPEINAQDPGLYVREMQLNFRIRDIYRKRIVLRSVLLDSVYFSFMRAAGDSTVFPWQARPAESDSGGSGWRLVLESLHVKNSTFVYQDKPLPLDITLSEIVMEVTEPQPGTYAVRSAAGYGRLWFSDRDLFLNRLEINGSINSDCVCLDQITLESPALRTEGTFHYRTGRPPEFSLDLRYEADLTAVEAFFRIAGTEDRLIESGSVRGNFSLANPTGEFDYSLRMNFDNLTLGSWPVASGSTEVRFWNDTITVNSLDFTLAGGQVTGRGLLVLDSSRYHSLHILLNELELSALWPAADLGESLLAGQVSGFVSSSGPGLEPGMIDLDLHVFSSSLTYAGQPGFDFSLRSSGHGGRYQVDLSQDVNSVSGVLEISPDSLRGQFQAQVLQLGSLAGLLNVPEVGGEFHLQGEVYGSRDDIGIRGSVSGTGLRYRGFPVDTLAGEVEYRDGEVTIREGVFKGRSQAGDGIQPWLGHADLRGEVEYGGRISGTLQDPRGEVFIRLTEPGFRQAQFRTGAVLLEAAQQRIVVRELELRGDSLQVRMTGKADLSTRLGVGELVLEVPGAGETGGSGRDFVPGGRIQATVSFAEPGRWVFHSQGTRIRSEVLREMYPLPEAVRGILDYRMEFTGLMDHPVGRLHLRLDGPGYGVVGLDSVRGDIRLNNTALLVEELQLFQQGSRTGISGGIDLARGAAGMLTVSGDTPFRGRIILEEYPLAILSGFLPGVRSLDGVATADMRVGDRFRRPRWEGSVKVREGRLTWQGGREALEDLTLTVDIKDNVLRVSRLTGRIQATPFVVGGQIRVQDRQNFSTEFGLDLAGRRVLQGSGTYAAPEWNGALEIAELELGSLGGVFTSLEALQGRISGRVQVRGIPQNPQLAGVLGLEDGLVRIHRNALPLESLVLWVELADTVLRIVDWQGVVEQIPFRLRGELRTQDWRTIQARARLAVADREVLELESAVRDRELAGTLQVNAFDMALLGPFVTGIRELRGTAQARVRIGGTTTDPRFSGSVRLNRTGFLLPGAELPVTEGSLVVNLDDQNRISLDSARFLVRKGQVLARGEGLYQQGVIQELRLSIDMEKIKTVSPKKYTLNIDRAQLDFRKLEHFYLLEGDVVINNSRIVYNVQPRTILSLIQSAQKPVSKPSRIMENTRLDIRVRESQNVWLDNNLARLRLQPDINLVGTLSNPNITGRLAVLEGYILYLDRKFTIEQGILYFTDPNQINPDIHLLATARLKSYETRIRKPYTITLSISGPANQPVVNFISDPPLDQADIVAMLTVGMTRAQLLSKESGEDTYTLREAIQDRLADYSSERISSYASNRMGSMLGLDEITIEGNLFEFGDSWGPELVASKAISEKVNLTYSTTIGHANDNNIRLDYLLNENLSLEGQTDQRGRAGIDLKFKIKF